jgi:hypothetical protein
MIGWRENDDKQTRTNTHALRGTWTHGLSVQTIKAYASELGHWDLQKTIITSLKSIKKFIFVMKARCVFWGGKFKYCLNDIHALKV